MKVARPALCMALDPLPDRLDSGSVIHRHCLMPAGHDGFHRSRSPRGEVVHEWQWSEESQQPVLCPQDRLF